MSEVKLSSLFEDSLSKLGLTSMASTSDRADEMFQKIDAGNRIREATQKADMLALVAASTIAANRPQHDVDEPAQPLPRTAHVIVSLKRPEEVDALRRIYGDGFFLIGIASTEQERLRYLQDERGIDSDKVPLLMETDAKEADDWGQRTRDTFYLSDVFLRHSDHKTELRRFIDLVFGSPTETPTIQERSMYAAYSASFSSGDMARQVGAAIVNTFGDLVATGWNDVPKFGGGLYGPEDGKFRDMDLGVDPNDKNKEEIANNIRKNLGAEWQDPAHETVLLRALRAAGFFDITEYQRAVHAEMEAILACARNGQTTRGATLYVTTFPCHNCTKHIIAAGFGHVYYIEPYAKSKALDLHEDAITQTNESKKIPFSAFIGVGPRRYLDLFSLTLGTGYEVERKKDGKKIGWNRTTGVPRLQMQPNSYLDREELALESLKKLISL